MEQRPAVHGGHHDSSRAPSVSARARLAAAVREDRPGPLSGTRAEDAPPRLPPEDGLEPVRRLGGRSWLVREVRSGEHFVLRPCAEEPGPERDRSRAALRSLAVALAGRDEACLVAVRGLLGPAAAPVGLVEDFLRGGSLADRLAERGRLAPAEAAAVLRDAATGLAALHALGRCHGELSARQILFRGTTTPSAGPAERTVAADGAGLPAAVRAGTAAGSPEEDVRALGALGWSALTGRAPARDARRAPLSLLCPGAPPGLVRAVEAALAPDASARPTAAALADRFARAREPEPGGRRVAAARPGPVRTGGRRRAVLVGGAALLLTAGGAVLLPLGGADPSPDPAADPVMTPATTPAATPPARPPSSARTGPVAPGSLVDPPQAAVEDADPRRALRELVARRGEALRTGDARLLDEVYAPGVRAAAADRDTIARAAGGFPELVLEVESVRDGSAGSAPPGGVVLVAEVRVDGYRGGPGTIPSVVPAGDGWVQTVLVDLVHGERGWRLAGVEPAAGATAPPGAGRDGQEQDGRGPDGREPDGQEPARQDPRR